MEGNMTALQTILDELMSLTDHSIDSAEVQDCVKNMYNYINNTMFMGGLSKETFQMVGAGLFSMKGSYNVAPEKLDFISKAIGYYCSRM